MAKDKELVKKEDFTPALPGDYSPEETLEGIEPRLPQVDIIHQGQMFRMPDESKAVEFTGHILSITNINAYWSKSFSETGGGTPPDCFSMDGVYPDPMSDSIQHEECNSCPMGGTKAFGSDGGRGKACKNMKRVHIMAEGNFLPYRLTVPPSSRGAVNAYGSNMASIGIPYWSILTNFSLKETSNKDGIAYSQLVLLPAPDQIKIHTMIIGGKEATIKVPNVSLDELEKLKHLRLKWADAMRGQAVDATEYSG